MAARALARCRRRGAPGVLAARQRRARSAGLRAAEGPQARRAAAKPCRADARGHRALGRRGEAPSERAKRENAGGAWRPREERETRENARRGKHVRRRTDPGGGGGCIGRRGSASEISFVGAAEPCWNLVRALQKEAQSEGSPCCQRTIPRYVTRRSEAEGMLPGRRNAWTRPETEHALHIVGLCVAALQPV